MLLPRTQVLFRAAADHARAAGLQLQSVRQRNSPSGDASLIRGRRVFLTVGSLGRRLILDKELAIMTKFQIAIRSIVPVLFVGLLVGTSMVLAGCGDAEVPKGDVEKSAMKTLTAAVGKEAP